MNIAIPSVQVPFIEGGATLMTRGLKTALQKYGHNVEIITIPFKFFPTNQLGDNIDVWLNQDFTSFNGREVDRVIALQFPSYYVQHTDKTLWLMHQHRSVYELYEHLIAPLELQNLKKKITTHDNQELKNINHRFSISKNVSKRLKRFNNLNSTSLYHPPFEQEKFYCNRAEDYIFFPSRLEFLKRQSLLIKAMSYTKTPLKAIIAGSGSHFGEYKKMIEDLNIAHKVKLVGEITQEQKFDYYASSLAVVFPPVDEDYGYITLEAMLSSKPILTCEDSGGVLEFVINSQTGFITPPNPEQLAKKIDWFYHNKSKTVKMGKEAKQLYLQKDISWDNVVSKLLRS